MHNAIIAAGGFWLGVACLRGLQRGGDGLAAEASALPWPGVWPLIAASVGLLALAAAGNAENDVLDAAADRVNRPDRPLPSGRLSTRTATATAALLYVAGIALPAFLSPAHALLALGMAALLWTYNRRWKRRPLSGNLCVSLLCALAVLFPEWPGLPRATLLPALFAFLATLAREIAKDLQDIPGDRAAGYRTWPLVSGAAHPARAVFALHLAVAALLPWPGFLGYHASYWASAALLVFPPLALNLLALRRGAEASGTDWRAVQSRLKLVMLGGMATLALGAWV